MKNEYLNRVKEARKEFLSLNKDISKELIEVYQKACDLVLEEIVYDIKLNLNSSLNYRLKLRKQLEIYKKYLDKELSKVIKSGISSSASISESVQLKYIDFLEVDEDLKVILQTATLVSTKKVVEKIVKGDFYKDKKSLDNRIWSLTNKNIKDIDILIKANISKGANARELAEKLENYINPNNRLMAKTLEVGMNSTISYQSQRLARTSITHAFSETCVQNARENPFNIGLKWNLSMSHYERQVKKWGEDICDTHANQNYYNLGTGVFPASEYPIPHPNCLCYSTQVNVPITEANKELKDWINGASNTKLDNYFKAK